MEKIRMPVLFVGHGSPMNAIENNEFSQAWSDAAARIPTPRAIVCVSAHWETREPMVTAMPSPRTIHDFYGFPQELFDVQYPAPGSPDLAERIISLITLAKTEADQKWGLDHGTWSVLRRMYPQAGIPIIQLSLARAHHAADHFELGRQLQALRDEGVLVLGSGNIVHNLRTMVWEDTAFDWATRFDQQAKRWIEDGEYQRLIDYEKLGQDAALSINSAEHYLPLLYILGLAQPGDAVQFFADRIWGGSLSMRCVQIG